MTSDEFKGLKFCVVGSGFFGAVTAERIAADLGERVLVLEKRAHVGGNSYSEPDRDTGIEVHSYGSHIFHTSSREVWEYVNRFTSFNDYRHVVRTVHGGRVYSMPINLGTINQFFGKAFSPGEAQRFLADEIAKERISLPANFEEKAVSLIGRPLYEAFIKGYSEKQWETDLRSLPASIITRLPMRFTYNDRYFDDVYEGIPTEGYHRVFRRMFAHPRISVRTGVDFFALRERLPDDCLIVYTGPIDRFFNYKHGHLGWRTIRFEREVLPVADFQGTSVMNYAERAVPYTRIHEFKHFHPERKQPDGATVIFREYSKFAAADEEPYYPINTESDKARFASYREEMRSAPNVVFGGRLATYKYLDMHQVIGSALVAFDREIKKRYTENSLAMAG